MFGDFPQAVANTQAIAERCAFDLTRDLGFVKSSIDIKKYSDLSIVQEAAKRIK
jgi:DNA polymerase III alpha subunit